MKRVSLIAATAAAMAVGAAGGISLASAESEGTASEPVVVDGVTVHRAKRSDGGRAIYSLEPVSRAERAGIEAGGPRDLGDDPEPYATSGDVEVCELLAARPGAVNGGCALMLAMRAGGDLDADPGPVTTAHAVCGRAPGPGEIAACDDDVVTEAEVAAAIGVAQAAVAGRAGP